MGRGGHITSRLLTKNPKNRAWFWRRLTIINKIYIMYIMYICKCMVNNDCNDIFFHHCTFYWQGMLNLYTGSSNILTKYEVPRINFRGATGHLNIWSF